jgi:hypothetical protein
MRDDERRLLELLATSPDGATDALLLAHGFPLEVILGVIAAKLATATAERAGDKPVDVTRVRITDAGRQTLAERRRYVTFRS